jgi:RHS repeat-associated protein
MEKTDEVSGSGNEYTTEFRQYDPRVGRWWGRDPLEFKLSSWSPYSYSFNNPIYYIDPEGNIPYPVALTHITNKKFVWGKQPGMSNSDQEYGWRASKGRMHYGIDFNIGAGSYDQGIELLNLADGKVIESGTAADGGHYVIIRHGNGYITRFFHMQDKPNLKAGENVKEGQVIGKIGDTFGYAFHGHLEMAKISDANVSDAEALKQFKSYDSHFNPRDIIGKGPLGEGGDLQLLSAGKSSLSASSEWSLSKWWSSWSVKDWWDSWSFSDLWSGNQESSSGAAIINTGGGNLNIRTGPGKSFGIAGSLSNGADITTTGNSMNGWSEIKNGEGTGWISSDYIKEK